MSHIIDRLLNLKLLSQAIRGMLAEDIQEMRTINLENPEENLGLDNILEQSSRERKSRYHIRDLDSWSVFDWELELQLAPEFEDVREKIQEYQDQLRSFEGSEYEQKLQEALVEIEEEAKKILKKKIINIYEEFFPAREEANVSDEKKKEVPGLKVKAEEIGIREKLHALVLNLKGILNKVTASKISPLVEKLLDISQPYLIVDLTEVDWIENTALPPLYDLQKKLIEFQGHMVFVVVDKSFRKKIKGFHEDFQDIAFLDRGGAVSYLTQV